MLPDLVNWIIVVNLCVEAADAALVFLQVLEREAQQTADRRNDH